MGQHCPKRSLCDGFCTMCVSGTQRLEEGIMSSLRIGATMWELRLEPWSLEEPEALFTVERSLQLFPLLEWLHDLGYW